MKSNSDIIVKPFTENIQNKKSRTPKNGGGNEP